MDIFNQNPICTRFNFWKTLYMNGRLGLHLFQMEIIIWGINNIKIHRNNIKKIHKFIINLIIFSDMGFLHFFIWYFATVKN